MTFLDPDGAACAGTPARASPARRSGKGGRAERIVAEEMKCVPGRRWVSYIPLDENNRDYEGLGRSRASRNFLADGVDGGPPVPNLEQS
jgi:hypothetical protein